MRPARTVTELHDRLDGDLSSRKREIQEYRSLVAFGASNSNRQAHLRGAIAVLYAHWEGFVRVSGQEYFDYVKSQKLRHCDLVDSFVGLAFRKQINVIKSSKDPEDAARFVAWLEKEWASRANFPARTIIDTKSNLTVEVFRRIIAQLGLPYRQQYSFTEKTVMEPLLALRNGMAHGEWHINDHEVWLRQHEPRTLENMELLKSDIVDAAAYRKFALSAQRTF